MSNRPARRPAGTPIDEPSTGEIALTLYRAQQILLCLAESPLGRTVNEICTAVELPRHTVYRALNTMRLNSLTAKHGDQWRVGPAAIPLARMAAGWPVREHATLVLQELSDTFSLTATLSTVDGEACLTLDWVAPPAVEDSPAYRPALRSPVADSAAGIAVQASRSPQDGESEQVAEARKNGYAVVTAQIRPRVSVTSVAAPIFGLPGEPAHYSLGLMGEAERIPATRIAELGVALVQSAEHVQDALLSERMTWR